MAMRAYGQERATPDMQKGAETETSAPFMVSLDRSGDATVCGTPRIGLVADTHDHQPVGRGADEFTLNAQVLSDHDRFQHDKPPVNLALFLTHSAPHFQRNDRFSPYFTGV